MVAKEEMVNISEERKKALKVAIDKNNDKNNKVVDFDSQVSNCLLGLLNAFVILKTNLVIGIIIYLSNRLKINLAI